MNNWDGAGDEGCMGNVDFDSVRESCRVLGIAKLHRVNYQSAYWQRVFAPVVRGYEGGALTPNPDVLCNREIKFGCLYRWAVEEEGADLLATGHYARLSLGDSSVTGSSMAGELRQSRDLCKDQTYFLAAVDRTRLGRVLFPMGELYKKTDVKGRLVHEAGLEHLRDRRESMGLCFVGKRRCFQDFIGDYVARGELEPGRIVCLDTGRVYSGTHRGVAFYTLGQSVAVSGARSRLYVARKDPASNTLLVVDNLHHRALQRRVLTVESAGVEMLFARMGRMDIYCVVRSVDKEGVLVESVERAVDGSIRVSLRESVFAPCPGQWAVFYAHDADAHERGRLCLGGGVIIDAV